MGANMSLSELPADFPYFCLKFHNRVSNNIKLIGANEDTITLIVNAIGEIWPSAISNQGWKQHAYSIWFNGKPFSVHSKKADSIASKRMACHMLLALAEAGWHPEVSSCLLSTTESQSCWIFRRSSEKIVNLKSNSSSNPTIACLNLSKSDTLQLINASQHLEEIFAELAHGYGFHHSKLSEEVAVSEMKLRGSPWEPHSVEESVSAQKVLLEIVKRFESGRYELLTTANLKGTTDSIFFKQATDKSYPDHSNYMMLSLNTDKKLCMVHCPEQLVGVVGNCIKQFWPQGVSVEHDYAIKSDYFEFKLHGRPWLCFGKEAAHARRLITMILQEFLAKGWTIVSGLKIARFHSESVGSFLFKSCPPETRPHCCLSPCFANKIWLLNGTQELINVASHAIKKHWPLGVKREGLGPDGQVFEWELNGEPWLSGAYHYREYIVGHRLMTLLLHELIILGWEVVCCADISANFNMEKPTRLPGRKQT